MAALTRFCLLLVFAGLAHAQEPIIDMHLHALAIDAQGPPPVAICAPFDRFPSWDQREPYADVLLKMLKQPSCREPLWSPETEEALIEKTISILENRNIIGMLSGTAERVARWRKRAPERIVPGLGFSIAQANEISPSVLRDMVRQGNLAVFAEISNQYIGVAPDDPRMQPYWELMQELDIPVGIHVGPGPPGIAHAGASGYRARAHSPLDLEEVLIKYPRMRVYIMHAGYPMIDDLLAVLYAHPQVHVDVGVIAFTQPRHAFHEFLKRIVDAGFADRVMFGSDQMVWPEAIERSIQAIEQASFLSNQQKRDIFYNNAARFLRLTEAQVAQHRAMGR